MSNSERQLGSREREMCVTRMISHACCAGAGRGGRIHKGLLGGELPKCQDIEALQRLELREQ